MCTVTYIPAGNNFFFTSSRDELEGREAAALPDLLIVADRRIVFPKDPQGGGTWIAVHESGNVVILLNGAIKAHQPEPPYRKSRGLILIDLIAQESPADAFESSDFNGIEPFTVILFDHDKLYSGRWDGRMKWLESLNVHKPQIWSSVTLYDDRAMQKRTDWFNEWIAGNPHPGTLDIIHFHQKGGDGDPFNDILMKRENGLFTQSISSIRLSPEMASFRYLDLRDGKTSQIVLPLKKKISVKA